MRYRPRSVRMAWCPGAPSMPTSTFGAAACQPRSSSGVTSPHSPMPVAVREGWLMIISGVGFKPRR